MQAGGAAVEQLLAELGRERDPLGPHPRTVAVVGADPPHDVVGDVGADQLGLPADGGEVEDRHDPRQHGDVNAPGRHPIDQREVVVGGEEHLGDRELRTRPRLGHEHLGVVVEGRRGGVAVGEGGHADPEVAGSGELDELRGVLETARGRRPLRAGATPGVAAQRHDVAHPAGGVLGEDRVELLTGVADAGQVGDRQQVGLLRDPRGQPDGRVAAGPARPIGHRHEGGPVGLEGTHGVPELVLSCHVCGREELEGEGSAALGDELGHAAAPVGGHTTDRT